ncbi:MAG: hypothetical protein OIF32_07065 [Campylobacterales bacterium]|nr:hypothetical protein [Campylobacterales bacterium]
MESNSNQRSVSAEEFVESIDIDKFFDSGLILSKNGDILEVQGGEETITTNSYPFSFDESSNSWTIKSSFLQTKPILSETDLAVDTNELLITKSLYSYANITFNENVTVDVGSPFENGIVAKGNINFQKADIVGRVHSGGKITTTDDLKVIGTIQSKNDMTVGGDLDVNYLDLVYKAAKIASHEHFETPRLVWSKLFNTLDDKNGAAVFIYVDNALVDEEKLKEIIENGKESEYKFLSLVVGASDDSIGIQQRIEGISHVFKNKLEFEAELTKQGYRDLEITESLIVGFENLFFTYKGVGTFNVLDKSIGEANENNSFVELTHDLREKLISENDGYVIETDLQKKDIQSRVIELRDSSKLQELVAKYINDEKEYLSQEKNRDSAKLDEYSDIDVAVNLKYSQYLQWNNIKDRSLDSVKVVFSTSEDVSDSISLRGVSRFGDSIKSGGWNILDGWNVWMTQIAISDGLHKFNRYGRTWYSERSAIVGTAMMLKYVSLRYGLNKFQYNGSTKQSHVNSITNSFDSSRIISKAIGFSVNADALKYGIQRYLNENGVNKVRSEQINNRKVPSIFWGDTDLVIDDFNSPVILTLDERKYTNGGARFYNFVIIGTYKATNYSNYGSPYIYFYIYNPNRNSFMRYDVRFSNQQSKHITYVRPN